MECPKCSHSMEDKHFGAEVTLLRCTNCYGIWVGGGSLSKLRDVPMIDILDVGDAKLGELYNRVSGITCLDCDATMEAEQVYEQPHITLDICRECGSCFLDAGELRDLKHLTFGDWIRAMRIKLHFD